VGAIEVQLKRLDAAEALGRASDLADIFDKFTQRDSKWTALKLWELVARAELQLWIAEADEIQGAGLTKVETHLSGEVWVHLIAGAGENPALWGHFIGEIQKQSQDAGYDGFQVTCRAGWARFCKQAGLKETHRVYERRF